MSRRVSDSGSILFSKTKKRLKHKEIKKASILMTLLPLAACGGGDGGDAPSANPTPPAPNPTPTPPPAPDPDFIENPANVFVARDDAGRTLSEGNNSSNLTVTGGAGNDTITTGSGADVITGGAGNDTITTSGGNDIVRGGEGSDAINTGAGDDAIVIIGTTTASQYDNSDITNAGNGYNLSNLISLADLNGRTVSEVSAGEVINGGAGTNTLFIYGTVDLTGVTLSNVTILEVHSTVTFTPEQLAQFTTVNGDGTSTINIEIPAGSTDEYVLDLSDVDMSNVGAINIDGDITVKIDDASDLDGVDSISAGSGDKIKVEVDGADIGSTTIDLGDIADVIETVDELDIDENVTLEITDATDVAELGLTKIDGSGSIDTGGDQDIQDAIDDNVSVENTINNAPVGVQDISNAGENQVISVDVIANDTDEEGDSLSLISATAPYNKGSASVLDGKIQFDPQTDFDNLDEGETEDVVISYQISDGTGIGTGELTVTVTGSNDAPLVVTDHYGVINNRISYIDVIKNDKDPEGDEIILEAGLFEVGKGSVSISSNEIVFDPKDDFNHLTIGQSEEVEVFYTISDGELASTGSLFITVHSPFDTGPIVNDSYVNTSNNVYVAAGGLSNRLDYSNSTSDLLVIGSDGRDYITTGYGNDTIEGGLGNDELDGGDGFDYVSFITLEQGVHYSINGTVIIDSKIYYQNHENFEGVFGSDHDDHIDGDGSDNIIFGGDGSDRINGRGGNDLIESGKGGFEFLDGGEGFDILSYQSSDAGVTITLDGSIGLGGDASGDSNSNFEAIYGSDHDDILRGNDDGNLLRGKNGNDILTGYDGNDTLRGEEGDDRLNGNDGDDLLRGGEGADTLNGGDNGEYGDTADYFTSDAGINVNLALGTASGGHAEGDVFSDIENINGSLFDDTIVGDENDNRIDGNKGVDTIDSGAGDDLIFIFESDNSIEDIVDGGSGIDQIEFIGSSSIIPFSIDIANLNFSNIEEIGLSNTQKINDVGSLENLTLTIQDVIDITDENNTLTVLGEEGDIVTSKNHGWIQGEDQNVDGQDYHTYSTGGATLLIDTDITQDIS